MTRNRVRNMNTRHLTFAVLVILLLATSVMSVKAYSLSIQFEEYRKHKTKETADIINSLQEQLSVSNKTLQNYKSLLKQQGLIDPLDPPAVVIENGSMAVGASYIVGLTSGTTWMRNGSTGAIDYASSSTDDILEACIGNLTEGGKVFVTAGNYTVENKHAVDVADGFMFVGEGDATVFNIDDNDLFMVRKNHGYFGYFKIQGTGATPIGQAAIEQRSASHNTYDHITIVKPAKSAIEIRALSGEASSDYNTIKYCYVDMQGTSFALGKQGIGIYSDDTTNIGTGNRILYCTVENAKDTGIFLTNQDNSSIIGCKVFNAYNDGYAMNNVQNCEFKDNLAVGVANAGLWVSDEPVATARDVAYNSFTGNTFVESANQGMEFYAYKATVPQIRDNIISENIIVTTGNGQGGGDQGKHGLKFRENCFSNIVSNNKFYDIGGAGIQIKLDSSYNTIIGNQVSNAIYGFIISTNCDDNHVSNNKFRSISGNVLSRDIRIPSSTADDNAIVLNSLKGHSTPSNRVDDSGTNTVIKYNVGYVTESGGSQTVANGEDITHGLDGGTPTFISLTCANATYDGVGVSVAVDWANTDGTNISVDVYWTNGTTITNDVILVYWEGRTW